MNRLLLGLAVSAMLLRVAMPMLAAGVAHQRGVAVGSICSVYGVVAGDGSRSAPAGPLTTDVAPPGPDGAAPAPEDAHAGHDCALTALTELVASYPPAFGAIPGADDCFVNPTSVVRSAWADASAAWIARRKQGPPQYA